jgi:hypothetical protein
MDQHLENMVLEGGGGGTKRESYELMLYVAARHTSIDCWEKRGRKGYLFMIGDEMAYPVVKRDTVDRLIGPGRLQGDLPLEDVIAEVGRRYHLYFVIPGQASWGGDKEVLDFWTRHVGPQRLIRLEDPEETSESIALTIGLNEGAIDLEQGAADMKQRGIVSRTIDRVTRALAGHATGPTVDSPQAKRL